MQCGQKQRCQIHVQFLFDRSQSRPPTWSARSPTTASSKSSRSSPRSRLTSPRCRRSRKEESSSSRQRLTAHPLRRPSGCSKDGLGIVTTLRITKAKDEDNGKYTLLVKNTAGEAKAESMVDVMGKPKPPRVVKEIEPKQVIFLDGLKSGKMEVPVGNKNGFRFDRTSFQRPKNVCKRRKIY